MLFQDTFGIDLGSATVKVYSAKKDEILVEKNMVAIRNGEDLLAVGNDAYEMFEKNPKSIEVRQAVALGMIADVADVEIVVQSLVHRLNRHPGHRPKLYFAVPADMTEIEKRAYYAIAGGLAKIVLVERPIADAVALGLPITKTKGSLLVNIGAESTEISAIADQRIIISKIVKIGGHNLDEAICNDVRKRTDTHISFKTATRLKNALGDLSGKNKEARKVVGIDIVTGLPKTTVITATIINHALREAVDRIGLELKSFLERTPPQVRAAILAEGIYLTGGTTKLPGLEKYLTKQINCRVSISTSYDMTTVYGLKEIIGHKSLHHWTFTAKDKVKKS